jgi:hypothetical protein
MKLVNMAMNSITPERIVNLAPIIGRSIWTRDHLKVSEALRTFVTIHVVTHGDDSESHEEEYAFK